MKTKQTLQKLLDSTKRTQYIDKDVLKTVPEAQEGTLEFFKLDRYVTDDELEKEYESRGLIPAPIANIAEYDLENPEKIDEMEYVGSHWKDSKDKWCFVTFFRWYDGRRVDVLRSDDGWGDYWWFAGLRKLDLGTKTLNSQHLDILTLEKRIEALEAWQEKVINAFK